MKPVLNNDYNLQKDDVAQAVKFHLAHNFQLKNFSLFLPNERIGLLCDHAYLNASVLHLNQTEDIWFFVKFFPLLKAQADFAERTGAFRKEIFVYERFHKFRLVKINMIESCIPKCFATKPNHFIVLEYLTVFKPLDKQQTLDYATVIVVLKTIAKLHACSIIFEEKQSEILGKTYRLGEEFPELLEESIFSTRSNASGMKASIVCIKKSIDIFGLCPKLASGRDFRDIVENTCHKLFELVKPSKKHRNVLCHGDLWATNFLLSYDESTNEPQDCRLVDFQFSRYTPPAQDVLAMMYLTTSREFREKHMDELLKLYYNFLENNLRLSGYNIKTIISLDDFLDSCEERKLFGILQTAFYYPLILVDNQAVEEYFNDEELNRRALLEDRSEILLKHMEKDENYTRRVKGSIEDLKDYCDNL